MPRTSTSGGGGSDYGGGANTDMSSHPFVCGADDLFRRISTECPADMAREILKEVY